MGRPVVWIGDREGGDGEKGVDSCVIWEAD